jgi:hypothetical protein
MAKQKLQYTVTLDGEPTSFSSTRHITHAVVGRRVADGRHVVVATAGSRELAEKALRTQVSYLQLPKWNTGGGETAQKFMFGSTDAFSVVPVEAR